MISLFVAGELYWSQNAFEPFPFTDFFNIFSLFSFKDDVVFGQNAAGEGTVDDTDNNNDDNVVAILVDDIDDDTNVDIFGRFEICSSIVFVMAALNPMCVAFFRMLFLVSSVKLLLLLLVVVALFWANIDPILYLLDFGRSS